MPKTPTPIKLPATAENQHIIKQALPGPNVPLLYVEQMTAMMIGSFTSKIVLGLENPGGAPTPTVTLVMPTQSLHLIAKHIFQVLSSEDAQKQLENGFTQYKDLIK